MYFSYKELYCYNSFASNALNKYLKSNSIRLQKLKVFNSFVFYRIQLCRKFEIERKHNFMTRVVAHYLTSVLYPRSSKLSCKDFPGETQGSRKCVRPVLKTNYYNAHNMTLVI